MKYLDSFLQNFIPDGVPEYATQEQIVYFGDKLPKDLLLFWRTVGFGSFADGYLRFFDPRKLEQAFTKWILNADGARIPFGRNAFGQIYYWRDLSERAQDLPVAPPAGTQAGDVSYLDIHYGVSGVISYTFDDFLADFVNNDRTDTWHRFYRDTRYKMRRPADDEIYYFNPAIKLGGNLSIDKVDIGRVDIQMDFLFDLNR